jgi:hypothetical protein
MTITVRGLREVDEQLRKLGSKDGTRILKRAMFQAGAPIEDRAKRNAAAIPNGSGSLSQAIGRRVTVNGRGGSEFVPEMGSVFKVEIAPMRGNRVAIALHNLVYKRKRKGIFHGHFIEFGQGKVPARPIFITALRSAATRAVAILRREALAGIQRQLKRNAKK